MDSRRRHDPDRFVCGICGKRFYDWATVGPHENECADRAREERRGDVLVWLEESNSIPAEKFGDSEDA